MLFVCLSFILTFVVCTWDWHFKEQFLLDWSNSQLSLRQFCLTHDAAVPYTTAVDWVLVYDQLGTIEPMKNVIGYETRGRDRLLNVNEISILLDIIGNHPTWYYYEVRQEFFFLTGRVVTEGTLRNALCNLGFSHKKITKFSIEIHLILH